MAKKKTSARREKYSRAAKSKPFDAEKMALVKLKAGVMLEEHAPDICLKNAQLVRDALTEAFFEGDVSGFKEILAAHLRAISKDDLSKKSGVSRATVFRMLDTESNPSFENVSKVLSTLKIAV